MLLECPIYSETIKGKKIKKVKKDKKIWQFI